jgi:uncharacterized membrane protein YccC
VPGAFSQYGRVASRYGVQETRDVADARQPSRPVATVLERARNWVIGSDPGLLRLQAAIRTTTALAAALVILFALTKATRQPLTVDLLGVIIAMMASRAVNEPDLRRQKITMALVPLPAALTVTAGALLSGHRLAADVVFVVVMFVAVYVRRWGPRGTALGMVSFMAYFLAMYLGAKADELPWLIGAVLVGAGCSFVMSAYVLPDKPERVLRRTMRSLRARMAIVVDTTAEAVQAGRLDERRRRRLHARTVRLNDTALMVQNQIEDKVGPAAIWPELSGEQIALWLFDAELTVERVATAGERAAAVADDIPASVRADLVEALMSLVTAIRRPRSGGLQQTAELAQRLLDQLPATIDDAGRTAVRRLALAIIATTTAASAVRTLVERAESAGRAGTPSPPPPPPSEPDRRGLLPTTRQAIQVAVAASLAIVAGEALSPARWYWAVIATFVIFAGTKTWGETLTKGWQRFLGTLLGVPCGILVATLVSTHTVASVVLIFVCLFCAFYLWKVSYSLMVFWITTVLALLYGLLGEFTLDVLLLRIEETAVGAVIGVACAILVLPNHTRREVRNDTHAFLTTLAELVDASVTTMFGTGAAANPTDVARRLDRDLQQFRTTAKPVLAGVAGMAGRRSIRRALRVLAACDHYGRTLAANSKPLGDPPPPLVDTIVAAGTQIRRNIDALDRVPDHGITVMRATDFLDPAESYACQDDDASQTLRAAVHALRQVDRAVVAEAVTLGAEDALHLIRFHDG